MVPQKLDRFQIVSELGRSDLVSVYKADDPRDHRTVVLRAVRSDGFPTRVEEFRAETRATATLESPNIASVYETGQCAGFDYAVVEFVEGHNLQSLLDDGKRFGPDDVIDISRQVCSALDHAHSRGVFSSTLKPSNVVIEWDGNVKLVDFGISETTGQRRRSPVHYMSPEQLRGESIDARSNLFSWAAILYYMVTGKRPFPGADERGVMLGVLEQTPPEPREVDHRIPAGISRAIMRGLGKPPGERHGRGAEFVRELEDYKNFGRPKADAALPFMLQKHGKLGGPEPAVMEPATVEGSKPSPRIAAAAMSPRATAEAEPSPARSGVLEIPSAAAFVRKVDESPMLAEANPSLPLPEFQWTSPASEPAPSPAVTAAPADPAAVSVAEPPKSAPARPPLVSARPRSSQNGAGSWAELLQGSHQFKLLVFAAASVFVLLFAVIFTAVTYFHGRSSQSVVPTSATTDPSFLDPASPTLQPVSGSQPVANDTEPPPPRVRHFRPPPAPKVEAPVLGELAVDSTPAGAQVHVDGLANATCVTPCLINDLVAGQHAVTLNKPGYAVASHMVDVVSGNRASLTMPLTELGASLMISSDPVGANIVLDGKPTGKVTPAQLVVARGSHAISLEKRGYLEASTSAELAPGQVFRFQPALKETGDVEAARPAGKFTKLLSRPGAFDGMGRLQVRTTPKGAQIMLNRHMLDKPAPADYFLEPGNYELTLSFPGYQPVHKIITVERDEKLVVEENLQR